MKSPILLLWPLFLALCLISCQTGQPLPILGRKPVGHFSFLNQDSIAITNKTFDGKIYIANFFFTSCTTICPAMNAIMKYAKKLGAYGSGKWQFAHGSRDEIYNIAAKSYISAVAEDPGTRENFVHQGYLLLVDQQRRLRGAYDSDNPEQIQQLQHDIDVLLKE